MDVPVDLPFRRELRIFDGEYALRELRRENMVDECVSEERDEHFVHMQRECREVEIVGERLDGFTEPWQWWDRKWVVHCGRLKEEKSKRRMI